MRLQAESLCSSSRGQEHCQPLGFQRQRLRQLGIHAACMACVLHSLIRGDAEEQLHPNCTSSGQ